MKVVHLSRNDIGGGAARAAYRLHTEMLRIGIESKMFVLNKEKTGDGNIKTVTTTSKRVYSVFRDLVNLSFSKYANRSKWTFSLDISGVDVTKYPVVRDADVIYLHWINGGFMTLKNIEKLLRIKKKVIFVLHDMWALTGGCHYSFECEQYVSNGCKSCPIMESKMQKRIPHSFYKKKTKIFERFQNFEIITPSSWLGNCVSNTPALSKKKLWVLPNPLDYSVFKPVNKASSRLLLNIDKGVKLILFVADIGTNNPYKGWKYLEEALFKLAKDSQYKIEILVLGSDRNQELEELLPYKIHFTGRLFDEYSLSLVYNAADVFVTPSLADNLPSTVLESISCGTPVVGFRIGGIPDMIKHKENGYLAEYKNVEDLVEGIKFCLGSENVVALGESFSTDKIMSFHKEFMLNQ